MSGRTFGFQASWDETLRKLTAGLDIDGTQLRQSVSVAESMNQQLEEFINRSVVTYINDSGDVTIGGALSAAAFSGPLTGNADTATALATARAINGVDFDGSAAITVTAAAGTLTGGTLASGVTATSITTLGTLASLQVTGLTAAVGKMVVGQASFTREPWASSTIALGNYGFVGTQGSYATSLSWNYERGTDSGFHSLAVNSYASAGGIDIGNAGIYFRSEGSGYAASAAPAIRMTLTSAGDVGIGTTAPDTNLEVVGSARASTSFLVGASGDDGIGPVTGQFGNVQTVGSGVNNYEGYSISGRSVFMHDGSTVTGIYNDVDNQWLVLWVNDSSTRLYDSDGIVAFGADNYTSGGTGSAGNGYVGVSNYCGGFSGTTAVMQSVNVAGVPMKRLGFSTSSYEFKSGIEDLAMSDEAFMSLKPITYHPNYHYVDSTGDVTEIVGGHTLIPDSVEAGETAGLMPLKRAGFGLEDLYGREDTMILATEFAPDSNALIALLTLKLQETMIRVEQLETQAYR